MTNLQSSYLTYNCRSVEQSGCFGGVGSEAPDEVRLGVHQSAQQIVEPRVEILRDGRHWLIAILSAWIVVKHLKHFVCVDIETFKTFCLRG